MIATKRTATNDELRAILGVTKLANQWIAVGSTGKWRRETPNLWRFWRT